MKRQLAEMAGGTLAVPPRTWSGRSTTSSPVELDPARRPGPPSTSSSAGTGPPPRGLAAVGVGSVSAAVIGLSTLERGPARHRGGPGDAAATSLTRATPTAGPLGHQHLRPRTGPFSGWPAGLDPADRHLPVRAPVTPPVPVARWRRGTEWVA